MTVGKNNSSLALLLLWLTYCHGQLLASPGFLWKFNLDDSKPRTLQKGNAVVASQDGDHIFATASDGSLHIINRKNIDPPITTVFEPPAIDGTVSECYSGVSVVNDGTETSYLVYAVINGNDSAVFAVNLDGSLKWQIAVEGKIVGTPVVSESAVYITHNVDDATGYLSVLLLTDNQPELTASLAPAQGNAPLGPPTLSLETGEDVVAVAESWDAGYGMQGNVYIVVPSSQYDNLDGKGNESYDMFHASSWPFSAVTRPVMAGSSLWLGAGASNIGGWQEKDISKVLEGKKEDIDPRWEMQLDPSESDANQPLLTTPAISEDMSLLVVPGSNGELYGVGANDGQVRWSNNPGSIILAEPIVVDDVVYVIESENGILRQHSVDNGNQFWQLDCNGSDLYCENAVVADFSIAPSGNVLYYGDVSGNIMALQIANFETPAPTGLASQSPTMSPTLSPTRTSSPTTLLPPPTTVQPTPSFETWIGTKAPATTNDETNDPNVGRPTIDNNIQNLAQQEGDDSDSTVVIVGSVIGVLFVVAALVALFVIGGRRRKSEKEAASKTDSQHDSGLGSDLEYGFSRTPEKKSLFRKKEGTPATMGMDMDEEEGSRSHLDADDSTRDLNDAFSLVAASEGDDAYNQNSLMDLIPSDVSHMSYEHYSDDESNIPVPPPPPVPKVFQKPIAGVIGEGKKEGDSEDINASTSFANMYTEDSSIAESATATPAATPATQPRPSVSPTSTVSESSVYTASPSATSISCKTRIASNLMPILPDAFGRFMDQEDHEDAPADEAAMESSRERLLMVQPSRQHPYQSSGALGSDDESAPDDERMRAAPGAHYISNAHMQSNAFETVALRRDNSIDGSGAKFRTTSQMSSKNSAFENQKTDSKQEDTENWNDFLDELAEAEKMFSKPKFKSAKLLSDDESTGAGSSTMGYIGQPEGAMPGSEMSI